MPIKVSDYINLTYQEFPYQCPFCGNLELFDFDIEEKNNKVYKEVHCSNCSIEFNVVYSIDYIEVLDRVF
jgi:transcription elongation factor Elf1